LLLGCVFDFFGRVILLHGGLILYVAV
jgi:hypothetical protein